MAEAVATKKKPDDDSQKLELSPGGILTQGTWERLVKDVGLNAARHNVNYWQGQFRTNPEIEKAAIAFMDWRRKEHERDEELKKQHGMEHGYGMSM